MTDAADERARYEHAITGMASYGRKLERLFIAILEEHSIATHNVASRVKTQASAIGKRERNPERYGDYGDLTDLLGLRVVTFFPEDVDRAAAALAPHLKIDAANSTDKRSKLDADRFGYLSLHYIASMGTDRVSLVEYKQHRDITFEIQIRSILQHAWAEIEHDLGYNAVGGSIPNGARRRFSRLAGLLELADDEFKRLREDLIGYEKKVSQTSTSEIGVLEIDQSTISEVLRTVPRLQELDQAVAKAWPTTVRSRIDSTFAGARARELKVFGLQSVEEVVTFADRAFTHIAQFAEEWISDRDDEEEPPQRVQRGIGLFYMTYVLAAQADPKAINLWGRSKIVNGRPPQSLYERVKQAWQKVEEVLGPLEPFVSANSFPEG